jgi:hypothetical protein
LRVLQAMHRTAAIAVIALVTAGCIGSSAGSAAGPSSDRNPAVPFSKTVLLVTYYARHCPPGASCAGHVKSPLGNLTFMRVSRNLRCDPAGGEYTDPAAVCTALGQIVDKLATKNWMCPCALPAHPPEQAVGTYERKRRTIPLDSCSLCNLPGIRADLKLLLPGAQV